MSIATLELFYHSVAILSHRARSDRPSSNSTASYVRRNLSALEVVFIVEEYGKRDLVPLPIIPYALSLSLSVAFIQLRNSKQELHQKRASSTLEKCCTLLENQSAAWWSAGPMALLGRRALQECKSSFATRNTIKRSGVGLLRDIATPIPKSVTQNGTTEFELASRLNKSHPALSNEQRPRPSHMVNEQRSSSPLPNIGQFMPTIDTLGLTVADPDSQFNQFNNVDPGEDADELFTLAAGILEPNFPTNFDDPLFADYIEGDFGQPSDFRSTLPFW